MRWLSVALPVGEGPRAVSPGAMPFPCWFSLGCPELAPSARTTSLLVCPPTQPFVMEWGAGARAGEGAEVGACLEPCPARQVLGAAWWGWDLTRVCSGESCALASGLGLISVTRPPWSLRWHRGGRGPRGFPRLLLLPVGRWCPGRSTTAPVLRLQVSLPVRGGAPRRTSRPGLLLASRFSSGLLPH